MADICLIIPPSLFLLDERVFMTLGVLRVAAVLERDGRSVEMLDLSGIENFEEVARLHAKSSATKVFGLTATTPQMPAALKIARAIRSARPQARLILGGPHVTLVNAARKGERRRGAPARAESAFKVLAENFDVLVAGDGEEAVFEALKPAAPGLVDADDPASPLFLTNQRLNELPFPARHLLDSSSYRYAIEGEPAMSLIAQLGCPFACGFCGGRESPMLRRIRTRSTRNVVDEILQMHRCYGVKGFMLYDDELNVNTKMVELMDEIAAAQKAVGAQFRLRGFVKSQLFNDQQAAAMRRAGFRWILTGFESGSPRILQNINKKATREENTRCVEIARRHGLKVKALMSIGHPGESEQSVLETRQWLLEAKPDDFDVTIITTYPGTPYYDRAVADPTREGVWVYTFEGTGDKLYSREVDYTQVADYYKGDPDGGYTSYVFTDALTAERLVELRDTLERDVRRILNIPFNPGRPAERFEHSMGQHGLPPSILRATPARKVPV
ncbi:MAG: B12-binding domain-containing radical SAM protein [Elusimicrobia bacterium]|nr:B12-binding domain-containing radical SAM protein [Elusimicrobiota bacterium]MDE2425060.1 B12-binding domain-containing radical SAM protein [Elusimicrobiota bacterium]